jgi:hypothetical protein
MLVTYCRNTLTLNLFYLLYSIVACVQWVMLFTRWVTLAMRSLITGKGKAAHKAIYLPPNGCRVVDEKPLLAVFPNGVVDHLTSVYVVE